MTAKAKRRAVAAGLAAAGLALLVWWLAWGNDPATAALATVQRTCGKTSDFDITVYAAHTSNGVREDYWPADLRVSGQDFDITVRDDEPGVDIIEFDGVTYGHDAFLRDEWMVLPYGQGPIVFYADGNIWAAGHIGGFQFLGDVMLDGVLTNHYSAPGPERWSWEIWVDANARLVQTFLVKSIKYGLFGHETREYRSVYSGHSEVNMIIPPVVAPSQWSVTGVDGYVEMSWFGARNAEYYAAQCLHIDCPGGSCTHMWVTGTTTDTSATLSGLPPGTYTCRLRCSRMIGGVHEHAHSNTVPVTVRGPG